MDFDLMRALSQARRLLGLEHGSTPEQARSAWIAATKQFPPDIAGEASQAKMAEINAAYDILKARFKEIELPRFTAVDDLDDIPDIPMEAPRRRGPPLSEEQQQAKAEINHFIETARPGAYYVLHGWAGSGKTTVLGDIANSNPSSFLVTLAGKAADVLRRKTGAPADTIHSVFYDLREVYKREDGTEDMTFAARFHKNELYGRVVLCDECSMISADMANDMLITGCKIIAVGDPGQLPPVKGQQFFTKPNFTLQKIHRQALDSPIIRQAHKVRLGRGYAPDTDNFQVVNRPSDDAVSEADVILCWRNTTRNACNGIMRRNRGFHANHPQRGEPVLCLKNDAIHGVYNGGVYELAEDFNDGDSDISLLVNGRHKLIENVRFEGMRDGLGYERENTKFTYGYALTVHKSQGSEWDNVILMDEYSMEDARVQWVYTGITRAAKRMTVVKRR